MDATLLSLSRWFPASATKRVKTKEQSAYTATSATASTAVARNTTIGNSTAATTWITAVTTRSMFIRMWMLSARSRCSPRITGPSTDATRQGQWKRRSNLARAIFTAMSSTSAGTRFSTRGISLTLPRSRHTRSTTWGIPSADLYFCPITRIVTKRSFSFQKSGVARSCLSRPS